MDKNVHIIELHCSPTQTPEEMPLCFEDLWANNSILRGGGWTDLRKLLLCRGVRGYADSGPGLESVED